MAQDWFAQQRQAPAADDWFSQQQRPASPQTQAPAQAKAKGVTDHVREGLTALWDTVNPIPGIKAVATDPVGTVRGVLDAQGQLGTRAAEAYRAGNTGEAIRLGANYLIPVLGPGISAAQEALGRGDYGEGVGTSIGLGLSTVAPPKVAAAAPARLPAIARNANPAVADAAAWGLREGIPVDAATATGNQFVRAGQHISDSSLGGAMVAPKARQAQAEGLTAAGQRLADRAHPSPMTAEGVGAGVTGSIESSIRTQHGAASDAYGRLRDLESDPKLAKTAQRSRQVETGILGPDGKPVTRTETVTDTIPLGVDLTASKRQLQPMYEALMRKKELTGALIGGEARALTALDALMQAPDMAPLSVVDSALSDLKAMSRGAAMPELRSGGQASAANIVASLDRQVLETARKADPRVMEALQDGRRATVAKYVAADVLEALDRGTSGEPVRVFNRLTGRDDTAVGLLRDVKRQAPDEIPKIGRAVIDDLLAEATAEGGFGRARTVANKWRSMGAETKGLLFTPDHVKDLDRFFLLANRMADSPNPSGTAHTLLTAGQGGLILTEPVTGAATVLGLAGMSKLLHSPTGARLLSQGLDMPRVNKAAATGLAAHLLSLGGREWTPAGEGR